MELFFSDAPLESARHRSRVVHIVAGLIIGGLIVLPCMQTRDEQTMLAVTPTPQDSTSTSAQLLTDTSQKSHFFGPLNERIPVIDEWIKRDRAAGLSARAYAGPNSDPDGATIGVSQTREVDGMDLVTRRSTRASAVRGVMQDLCRHQPRTNGYKPICDGF